MQQACTQDLTIAPIVDENGDLVRDVSIVIRRQWYPSDSTEISEDARHFLSVDGRFELLIEFSNRDRVRHDVIVIEATKSRYRQISFSESTLKLSSERQLQLAAEAAKGEIPTIIERFSGITVVLHKR